MSYLEEAAGLLRKATTDNERRHDTSYSSGKGALHESRLELARRFAELAAIEKGLLPVELARVAAEQLATATRRTN